MGPPRSGITHTQSAQLAGWPGGGGSASRHTYSLNTWLSVVYRQTNLKYDFMLMGQDARTIQPSLCGGGPDMSRPPLVKRVPLFSLWEAA